MCPDIDICEQATQQCNTKQVTNRCEKFNESHQASASNSTGGLCAKTIEECAKVLDKKAAAMKEQWEDYLKKGGRGPATTFYTVVEYCAELVRELGA